MLYHNILHIICHTIFMIIKHVYLVPDSGWHPSDEQEKRFFVAAGVAQKELEAREHYQTE